MNRKILTRWLNEYLDGEIGLADKAELERLMIEDPALQEEYRELRQIGLMMGNMPEVNVHPYRFRRKLSDAIDQRDSVYFTPQRAFAASMVFSLVIICLTFGLFFYQQSMTLSPGKVHSQAASNTTTSVPATDLTLSVNCSSEKFFSRLALETRLGLVDPQLVGTIMMQSTVYEGAHCVVEQGLETTTFPAPLPLSVRLRVYPHQVRDLAEVSRELSGVPATIDSAGSSRSVAQFLQDFNPKQNVSVVLKFN